MSLNVGTVTVLACGRSIATLTARWPLRKIVTLAGRKDIPGSMITGFPAHLSLPRKNLPKILDGRTIAPTQSVQEFAGLAKHRINTWMLQYGAVLLTNSPLTSPEDFGDLMLALGFQPHDYTGGTGFRSKTQVDNVLNASDEPPNFTIELHSEKSDNETFPKKVIFYCWHPADISGGESPIVHSRDILSGLNNDVMDKLENKGICYVRFLRDKRRTDYMSWQTAFQTSDQGKVVTFLGDLGYEFEWQRDGTLAFWKTQPAFRRHPLTGERVWFNSLQSHHESYFYAHPKWGYLGGTKIHYPLTCYYGDQTPIEEDTLRHVREVTWRCAVGITMRENEVLFMDNMQVQHGRMAFEGTRRMLAYLSD